MSNDVVWVYQGGGAFLDGVPARDLTAADLAGLDVDFRLAVENSGLYGRAVQSTEPEPEPELEEANDEKAEESARGSRRARMKE